MAENNPLENSQMDKTLGDIKQQGAVTNKILGDISKHENDTGEMIGDLLKNEKSLLDTMKENNKSIKEIADSNKRMAHAAEEEKREAKTAGGAGTVGFGKQLQASMKEAMREISPMYAGATNPIMTALKDIIGRSSLAGGSRGLLGLGGAGGASGQGAGILGTIAGGGAGFLIGFLTPVVKAYQTLFKSFYTGLSPVFNVLGKAGRAVFQTFMETFPLADELKGIVKYIGESFSILGKMLLGAMKSIGGVVDYGLVMLRSVFGSSIPRLKTILGFFGDIFTGIGGKLRGFLSADGILYGTMNAIEKLFGYGAIDPFIKAFEFGGKLAKFLPFLTVIPTAIETVVSAFKKFETEGFKGVFKAIMVGLLKGVAAFFTLGLSDFALDFEKMYSALSASLDGIFSEISGFVNLFVDVFKWLFGTMMQLWNGILKPIFVSLYEDALKPIFEALSALGDFAMILFDVVFTLLKPVIAIARFAFKLIFEVVKLVYDFVIYPIISLLVPIFKVLFKTIGILLTPVTALFQILTIVVGNFWNKFLKPIVNFITDLFSAGAEMGSLSELIGNALSYWGEVIKAGWDFIIGYYEMITDTIADAMMFWWELITDTWNYVYGLWDKLTDMLAYGMLWWWDAIKSAWNYVYNLWDQTTSLLADGMLIWAGWIEQAWDYVYGVWDSTVGLLADGMLIWAGWIQDGYDYVVGLWEDLTDALAYGILWWHEKITAAWDYVVGLWEFAVEALAESLEPVVSPIMEFFDFVGNLFGKLKQYASSILSFIPGMGGGEETSKEVQSPVLATTASSGSKILEERRREREERKKQLAEIIARENTEYGVEGAAAMRQNLRQQMSAGGGAAGGVGITNIVNNAPTTNISGGGGGAAIPVPLSPNPIRHADPTRALISN